MHIKSLIRITWLGLLCMTTAYAEIYTCKDANGNKIYTDSPNQCADAEKIKTDALPTLVPTKPISIPAGSRNKKPLAEKNKYLELVITAPKNDAMLRDNQGNLTINFRIVPGLKAGHKFVVSLGGKEVYRGTSTIASLNNVDRGSHSIGLKVVDAEGNTKISAESVQFTLQRFSALQNDSSTNLNNANDSGNDDNGGADSTPSNQRFPSLPKLQNRAN